MILDFRICKYYKDGQIGLVVSVDLINCKTDIRWFYLLVNIEFKID